MQKVAASTRKVNPANKKELKKNNKELWKL